MRPNPNTSNLNDKIIANDILIDSRFITEAYAKSAVESSTPSVRQTLASLYMDGLSQNERVFRFMQQRGWYSVEKADQQQVGQLQSKFTQGGQDYGLRTQIGGQYTGQYGGQYNVNMPQQTTQWGAPYGVQRY